jgi:hypothetical protein
VEVPPARRVEPEREPVDGGVWVSKRVTSARRLVSFPPGTLCHPPDVDVEVRVVATTDWSVPLQRYAVFGGQGTINVNSWAPDSSRFAFVAYPFGSDSEEA